MCALIMLKAMLHGQGRSLTFDEEFSAGSYKPDYAKLQ
jgi:hypothetical protein